jgi:hypothetical protein
MCSEAHLFLCWAVRAQRVRLRHCRDQRLTTSAISPTQDSSVLADSSCVACVGKRYVYETAFGTARLRHPRRPSVRRPQDRAPHDDPVVFIHEGHSQPSSDTGAVRHTRRSAVRSAADCSRGAHSGANACIDKRNAMQTAGSAAVLFYPVRRRPGRAPSVVRKVGPLRGSVVKLGEPTATPVSASAKDTPHKATTVPLSCATQVTPPFSVRRMVPRLPTTIPVLASTKDTA